MVERQKSPKKWSDPLFCQKNIDFLPKNSINMLKYVFHRSDPLTSLPYRIGPIFSHIYREGYKYMAERQKTPKKWLNTIKKAKKNLLKTSKRKSVENRTRPFFCLRKGKETGKHFWKDAETRKHFLKTVENQKDSKRQWIFLDWIACFHTED